MLSPASSSFQLQRISMILIAIMVLIVTVSFVRAPGQGDIVSWERWENDSDTLGLVNGYAAIKADYPPYSSVILFFAVRAVRALGGDAFAAAKLAMLLFLILTSLAFGWWTKNFLITLGLHFALFLDALVLGYLDILFAPTLLLALWFLKERKLMRFAVFYSMTCLIKWQPILIAPFIALYLLNIDHIRHWKQIEFKKLIGRVLLPSTIIFSVTLLIFGILPVLGSLKAALSHNFLSGNALNFDWILTHFLHVFYPDQFGPLAGGQFDFIRTTSPYITLLPRLLFILFYTATLIAFFRRGKNFEALINFSVIGYLAYFIFNPGVHENHLFLVVILSVVLFWLNRDHLATMIILIVMSNINLVLFYGLEGTGLGFSRVVANIDMALLLSIFNVCFFVWLWLTTVSRRKALPIDLQPHLGT